MNRIKMALSLTILICMCACSSKPNVETARAVSGQISNALSSQDLGKLKASMTDDVLLIRDAGPDLSGRDAVAAKYAAAFKNNGYDVVFSSISLEAAGEVVIDHGKITASLKTASGKGPELASGQYFHVLRLQRDGNWGLWRGTWKYAPPVAEASCCTGVQIGDSCVAEPASGGCPADHPIRVLKP